MKRTILVGAATLVVATSVALSSPALAKEQASADAEVTDAQGRAIGTAKLTQREGDGVKVDVRVEGLAPGNHGIHIHSVGLCEPPAFATAGPHFNPEVKKHGLHNPEGPHLGDLPNLQVRKSGKGALYGETDRVSLLPGPESLFDADGSAVVIHAAEDDQVTDPTGNSGARIACGVIREAR